MEVLSGGWGSPWPRVVVERKEGEEADVRVTSGPDTVEVRLNAETTHFTTVYYDKAQRLPLRPSLSGNSHSHDQSKPAGSVIPESARIERD
jgi:hypothetical protein